MDNRKGNFFLDRRQKKEYHRETSRRIKRSERMTRSCREDWNDGQEQRIKNDRKDCDVAEYGGVSCF